MASKKTDTGKSGLTEDDRNWLTEMILQAQSQEDFDKSLRVDSMERIYAPNRPYKPGDHRYDSKVRDWNYGEPVPGRYIKEYRPDPKGPYEKGLRLYMADYDEPHGEVGYTPQDYYDAPMAIARPGGYNPFARPPEEEDAGPPRVAGYAMPAGHPGPAEEILSDAPRRKKKSKK